MLKIFDFEDTLHDVCEEFRSTKSAPLESLRGQKLGINETILYDHMTQFSAQDNENKIHQFKGFCEFLKRKFESYQISFLLVSQTGFFLNDPLSLQLNHLFIRCWWKVFYHQQVARETKNEELRAQKTREYAEIISTLVFDNCVLKTFGKYYDVLKYPVFSELGFDYVRPPKLVSNQLAWMLDNRLVSAVTNAPLILLYPNVNQAIYKFDFQKDQFWFYDFYALAKQFETSVDRLRCAFFLYSAFTVNKGQNGEKLRVLKACVQPIDKIIETYKSDRLESKRSLIAYLHSYRLATEKLTSEAEWVAAGCQLLSLDAKILDSVKNELFDCQVITDKAEFLSYPFRKSLQTKRFSFSSKMHDFLTLSCMTILPDPLMCLMAENLKNTWVYPLTAIHNFQMLHLRGTYFKEQLERSLFRILSVNAFEDVRKYLFVYSHEMKTQLRTDGFYNVGSPFNGAIERGREQSGSPACGVHSGVGKELPAVSKPMSREQYMRLKIYCPSVRKDDRPLSAYECFRAFVAGVPIRAVTEESVLSASELSASAHLTLLEQYGYLSLGAQRLEPIGELLHRHVSPEFFEVAIFGLELLKLRLFLQVPESELYQTIENLSMKQTDSEPPTHSAGPNRSSSHNPSNPPSLAQKAMQKEHYESALKINNWEAKIDIIDLTVRELEKHREQYPHEAALYARIKHLFDAETKSKIDFVSQVLIVMTTDVSVRGIMDYSTSLFFERLYLIMMGFDVNFRTIMVHNFMRTATRNSLSTLTKAFQKSPYVMFYSNEFGALAKKLLSTFLIYKELVQHQSPLSKDYAHMLRADVIEKRYKLSFKLGTPLRKLKLFYKEFGLLVTELCGQNSALKASEIYRLWYGVETILVPFCEFYLD